MSQPIKATVTNFASGVNSALMIASNAFTASPTTPLLRPPRIGESGFGIEIPVPRNPFACACGAATDETTSTTASTTMPANSSPARPRSAPGTPRRRGRGSGRRATSRGALQRSHRSLVD